MIDFLDIKKGKIEKSDINREKISTFFSDENYIHDVITVYDKGKFYGLILCDDFCNNILEDEDKYIVRDIYILTSDNMEVFADLKRIMKEQNITRLPIVNQDDELICIAVNKEIAGYELEILMKLFENGKCDEFLKNVYFNRCGVRIHDLNEYGFRFHKVLKKCGIPVNVVGEKWDVFFPDYIESETSATKDKIVDINADGGKICGGNYSGEIADNVDWMFLRDIAVLNCIRIIENYKKKFKAQGINILTVYFPQTLLNMTEDEQYRHEKGIAICYPNNWRQNDAARKQVFQVCGQMITFEEYMQAQERKERETIYLDGFLTEVKRFGNHSDKIYVIGPCFVDGSTVMRDEESFGFCLSRYLEELKISYSVICIKVENALFSVYEDVFQYLSITENDIVLVVHNIESEENRIVEYTSTIDIEAVFEKRDRDWFYDVPIHTNFVGNKNIARIIADEYLMPILKKKKEFPTYLQIGEQHFDRETVNKIELYLKKIESMAEINKKEHIGSIIMNCNPMTKGHLYLINKARTQCDFLYVFVVEEDKSEFSFKERYKMVAMETDQMEDVAVVPSGEFIISALTLPIYFLKEERKDAKLDANLDLKIFGEYIAPRLGITERFVGEERIDKVTKQYNEQMKKILPYYGIKLTEIPRLCYGEEIISASKVRKLLRQGSLEKLKNYVSERVFDYILNRA